MHFFLCLRTLFGVCMLCNLTLWFSFILATSIIGDAAFQFLLATPSPGFCWQGKKENGQFLPITRSAFQTQCAALQRAQVDHSWVVRVGWDEMTRLD